MKKEISIIIPCYNTEQYIAKCLDSVTGQLGGFDYEIILVDDASKDNTVKAIEDYVACHSHNITLINYIRDEDGVIDSKAVEKVAMTKSAVLFSAILCERTFLENKSMTTQIA